MDFRYSRVPLSITKDARTDPVEILFFLQWVVLLGWPDPGKPPS